MQWCYWLLLVVVAGVWAQNDTDVKDTQAHCSEKPELTKTILCHYGGWIRPSDLDVCLCSLIVLTDWGLDDDLTLHHPEFGDLKFVSELKRKNDKLKVTLLLGSANEDLVLTRAAADPIEAAQLAEGVSEFLTQHDLDGIALQWDPASENRRDNFTALLEAFRQGLVTDESESPLIIVSIARTFDHINQGYDFLALDEYVDYYYLPAYNFTDLESHVAIHHSRLMGSDALNADSMLDLVIGLNASVKKIILGVPMYGIYYHLVDNAVKHDKSPPAKGNVRAVSYQHICKALQKGNWTIEREDDKTAPFAFKRKTWIGYDDSSSIRIKSKYAILRNLAGIGFWRIDQDDYNDTCKGGKFPLLNAAYNIFSELIDADQTRIMRSLASDLEPSGEASESVFTRAAPGTPFRITRIVDRTGQIHVIQDNSQTNMVCTRPGYYRHPDDCSHFYRCIKFNQFVDDFTIFEYSCPPGLVFDEKWETCNWPSATSPCGGSSEIFPVPRSKFFCTSEGYFTDPENCRWFYKCSDLQGDGTLTAFEFRCPFDLAFDETKIMCEWRWKVPGCGKNGSPHNKPPIGTLPNSGHIPDFRPPRPGHSLTSSSPNDITPPPPSPPRLTAPGSGRETHSNDGGFSTGIYDGRYPNGSPGPDGPFPDGSAGPDGPFPDGPSGPSGPFHNGPSGPNGPFPGDVTGPDGSYLEESFTPTASGSFDVSRSPHVVTESPDRFTPRLQPPVAPEVDNFEPGVGVSHGPSRQSTFPNTRFPVGPSQQPDFNDGRLTSRKPVGHRPSAPGGIVPEFDSSFEGEEYSTPGFHPTGGVSSHRPQGPVSSQEFSKPTTQQQQYTGSVPQGADYSIPPRFQPTGSSFGSQRPGSSVTVQFTPEGTQYRNDDSSPQRQQYSTHSTFQPTGGRSSSRKPSGPASVTFTRPIGSEHQGSSTGGNQFQGRTTVSFTDYGTPSWTDNENPFEGREFGDSTEEPIHRPGDFFGTNSINPSSPGDSRESQRPPFDGTRFPSTHRPHSVRPTDHSQPQRPFGSSTNGFQEPDTLLHGPSVTNRPFEITEGSYEVGTFPQGPPVTGRPFGSSAGPDDFSTSGRFSSGHQLPSAAPDRPSKPPHKKPLIVTHRPKLPPGYIPGHIIGNSQCQTSLGVNGEGQNYGTIEIKNPPVPDAVPRSLNWPSHDQRNLRKGDSDTKRFKDSPSQENGFPDHRRLNNYNDGKNFGSRINRNTTRGTTRIQHQSFDDYDQSKFGIGKTVNSKAVNTGFHSNQPTRFTQSDRSSDLGKIVISTSVNAEGESPMKITISTQASITDDDYENPAISQTNGFNRGTSSSSGPRNIVKHISNGKNKFQIQTSDQPSSVTRQQPQFETFETKSPVPGSLRSSHTASSAHSTTNRVSHSHEDYFEVTPEFVDYEDEGFGNNGEGAFTSKRRKHKGDTASISEENLSVQFRHSTSAHFSSDSLLSSVESSGDNRLSTPPAFGVTESSRFSQRGSEQVPLTTASGSHFAGTTKHFRKPVTGIPVFLHNSKENALGDNGIGPNSADSSDDGAPRGSKVFDNLPGRWANLNGTSHVGPVICERAGLFRHPDDCSLFYECYWDRWLNAFTIHFFECPVRLAFDHSILGCNWPFRGPPCHQNEAIADAK